MSAKERLNYRNGKKTCCCRVCAELTNLSMHGIGGTFIGVQPRCSPIGTGASRKYRIRMDGVCDAYKPREV